MNPEEQGKIAAALMRVGYAVEIDLRHPLYPVSSVVGGPAWHEREESTALGYRVASQWQAGRPGVRAGAAGDGITRERVTMGTIPTPTMWVSDDLTALDQHRTARTPGDALDGGLGAFLGRVDRVLTKPSATVLLDGDAARRLGLGDQAPKLGGLIGLGIADAREAGWTVRTPRRWTTFHRQAYDEHGKAFSRSIHVGVLPWMREGDCPLLAPGDALATLERFRRWYATVGVPYHGQHGGLPALALMREQKRKREPFWRPDWTGCVPAHQATETIPDWRAPREYAGRYVHPYDCTRQHLAAAGVVALAVDQLAHHAGPIELDEPTIDPGYYRITVPEWSLWDRLPHPCGAYTPGASAWVTAPTLTLVHDLAEQWQVMALPEVHESWTASGTRVLREWSATIGRALDLAELPGARDDQLVSALKTSYKAGRGMLERSDARVYRPDWSHAIQAQARVNLFRKVWTEMQANGRYPQRVETDCVWYASDETDGTAPDAWPGTFRPRLPGERAAGSFKWEGHKMVDRMAAAS